MMRKFLACTAVTLATGIVSAAWLINGASLRFELESAFDSSPNAAGQNVAKRRDVPWTTSRFRGTPEPPLPYRAERVFPKVNFKSPTVITSAPGTDRLFVGEQKGMIYSVPQNPAVAQPDPFLDTEVLVERLREQTKEDLVLDALYGLTFHPGFAENRYCYVCYVVSSRDKKRGEQHPEGTRVSRLRVSRTDPPRCDPESEQLVISWLQGGHNGGCLKFGPEGCLYISTGDGGNAFPPDGHNSGQDVTNLLSAILRIDVDHPQGEKLYSIPADNPFLPVSGARGEIWAFGLRNPWKMSFDRARGDLWVGDVGWELWELIYRVRKGDNYGWSLVEGRQPVHAERQRGPAPIVPPTIEIPHTEGVSVTGGFVYRGRKFPELAGQYIFGDWETRRIWSAPADAPAPIGYREIMEPTVRIVDFAEDHQGELYLLDYDDGAIYTLAANQTAATDLAFPRQLSESGIYASVAAHQAAAGVVPFSINAEQWADGATAERMIGVPGADSIQIHAKPRRVPGTSVNRSADFPADTVLVKTLSLPAGPGSENALRRVETQVLHFDGRTWRGYTYEWNEAQTDARLVEAAGKTRVLSVADPQAANGRRQQTWRFASRTECLRCHNPRNENLLAFTIPQLNRDAAQGGTTANQIHTFWQTGLFNEAPPEEAGVKSVPPSRNPGELPRFANPYDVHADLNERSRVYLHVNCGHCHRRGGGGSAYVHLNHELALSETGALGVRPSQGTFGIHDAKIIAPGDPYRSVLYFRMAKLGPGHMPHIGGAVLDTRGLELIHDWIRQLPSRPVDAQLVARLAALDERSSAERAKLVGEALADPSRAAMLFHALQQHQLTEHVRHAIVEAAGRHTDAAVRDLFESFLPEEQRVKRLGEAIQPAELLKLAGDAARGRELFHKTSGIQCRTCHKIAGDGIDLGPDLSQIGKKYDRAKLLESILEPSKNIEPQFVTWVVETAAGKVQTGLLVRRDAREIVIKDAQNKEYRFAATDIETAAPQQKSLMPELLLREMTAQQVADLLAYLESLK